MKHIAKFSEEEMKSFAEEMANRVKIFPEGGQVLFLRGDVGAGKTTFTRFFSQALGADSGTSPTFSLLEKREISDEITLFHGDFYRGDISRVEEIMDEYQEMQEREKTYIWVLEWFPEELISDFFGDVAKIFLDFDHGETPEYRNISLSFENPHSATLADVERLHQEYKTPVHIQEHIEMVRKIAVTVAKKLLQNNVPVDVELVENSALLHDVVKYVDFPKYTPAEKKRYKEKITPEKLQVVSMRSCMK